MRTLLPALLAAFISSTANAAPADAPISNKAFGDGGGYKHPDAEVSRYFEAKPTYPDALKDESRPAKIEAKAVAPETPSDEPEPKRLSYERPRPRPNLDEMKSESSSDRKPSAHAAATAGDDSASDDARRDYETRLFGASAEPRRPGLADPSASPDSKEAAPFVSLADAPRGEGMLFVSLELDPQEAGSLRDAVAGLGSAASFRPDARFQPIPGERGAVRISGWLPVSRLGDAISRPGVKRVSVERGSRPAPDERVAGSYLVTLRVTDPARPDESVAETVKNLTAETGFKFERVMGIESIPGGAATAVVSGTLPVSRLSRALGFPAVVRIAAAPVLEPAASAATAPASSKKGGFVNFVMAKGLWLVLLTLLLALPSIGDALKKGLAVFVPYR